MPRRKAQTTPFEPSDEPAPPLTRRQLDGEPPAQPAWTERTRKVKKSEQSARAAPRPAAPLEDLVTPGGGRESPLAQDPFAASHHAIVEARRVFQADLDALAGRTLTPPQANGVVDRVNQICEELGSVLQAVDGRLVSLRAVITAGGAVEIRPFDDAQEASTSSVLPPLHVVPISSLPLRDALMALGRMSGRRQAEKFTAAHQSRAGKAAADRLSAEQRSERASRAVQARWARARRQRGE